MSKSKGNVVTPIDLFEKYGSDAVRYWAASARPGIDTAFSEDQMKVGRKLATKLLNVTKFVLGLGEADMNAVPSVDLDRAMLARLAAVVDETTHAFEHFDYARSLERTESFFWWFCDDYVELVKARAYGTHGDELAQSARVALRRALSTLQRLFAPILPFATEEVWRWWNEGSVHTASWPTHVELTDGIDAHDDTVINAIGDTLALIRRAKTEAKVSQRAVVTHATVTATPEQIEIIRRGFGDIVDAGSVQNVEFVEGGDGTVAVDVTLEAASS
jgi:valyl-tRNA synthetase